MKRVLIMGSGLFMLGLAMPLMGSPGETNSTEGVTVTGIGQAAGGGSFAIVRVEGTRELQFVKAGDVLPVATPDASWKVKFVSIGKGGVEVDRFDVALREKEPPKPAKVPDEVVKPVRPKYELRDPFWPVGYDPNAG